MSKRLYVGKLPPDSRTDDVQRFFEQEAGSKVVDCRVMTGFGFIEFETIEDAENALRLDGRDFEGSPIVVQFAKENRPRREAPREMRSSGRRPGVPVIISNVSRDVSWQDLKDFGREAGGGVTFADIDRDVPGQGILEYYTMEEAERAVRELDGRELRGHTVTLRLQDSRSRRDRGGYEGTYRREYRRGYSRSRSRSRSPPRRYDDRYREREYEREYERDDRRRTPPRRHDDRREYPSRY